MRMKLIDFKEPVRLNFQKALEQREQSAVDLPNVLAGGEKTMNTKFQCRSMVYQHRLGLMKILPK